jgi:hypothetical protein
MMTRSLQVLLADYLLALRSSIPKGWQDYRKLYERIPNPEGMIFDLLQKSKDLTTEALGH